MSYHTFVTGMRGDAIGAPCPPVVIDGPTNGAIVRAYTKHLLVPALKSGDIMVINNFTAN